MDSHATAQDTWRLFITAHAKLINAIDKRLTEAGKIPLHWYDVLIELYEAPKRRLKMGELAERVVLSRSGLTRLVDKLEGAGYLHRDLDAEDRRSFYAILTDAGHQALREAWPLYAEGIATLFAEPLTDEELQTIQMGMGKILRQLEE